MNILKQTNPSFPQEIRRYGCRFMSLLAIPQWYSEKSLNYEQVMAIFRMGKSDADVIGENCRTGKKEHLLMEHAFNLLGRAGWRCRQVGKRHGGNDVFWNLHQPYQYMVCRWITLGPDGHWTMFDHNGIELYDPWCAEEAVGIGQLPSYYMIRKREVDKRLLYRVWENPAVGG